MQARPLWGNIIIEPLELQTVSKSGISVPAGLDSNPDIIRGKVIAVGSGSIAYDGSPIPMEVPLNAIVDVKKHEAYEDHIDNKKYYVVDQQKVLVVH